MIHTSSKTPVVLLAFANDAEAPLRELAMEQDELMTIFRQPVREGKCELIPIAAATADKVIQAFQDYRGRIRIFHYGGHSTQDEIFLKSSYQQLEGIKKGSLAEFLALQQGLELIFLNSCLSLGQAAFYHTAGVKAVIATDKEIEDRAARVFAGLFYSGLATGADIDQAFQEAEKGFQLKGGEAARGLMLRSDGKDDQLPWKVYPEQLHFLAFTTPCQAPDPYPFN